MNRCLFIFLLFILCTPLAYAGERYGFQDIPFGTNYSDVISSLNKKRKENKITSNPIPGGDLIGIDNFKIGDIETTLTLWFDRNKQFFKITFRGTTYSGFEIETHVVKQMDFISKVFKNKYGQSSECFDPMALGISETEITPGCLWAHGSLHIFTGVYKDRFEYSAFGSVAPRQMEKAEDEFIKKRERNKAKEGAGKL